MQLSAIVLDLAALAIVVVCVIVNYRRGFLRSILSFFGTLAALLVAIFGARALAPFIFKQFFRSGLVERMAGVISDYAIDSTRTLLDNLVGFLPEHMLAEYAQSLGPSLDFSAPDIAEKVVDLAVAPFLTPCIAVICFFVLFAILMVVLKLLGLVARGVNAIPLVGTLNRILGAAVGILLAVIYIFLLLCIVWAYDWITRTPPVGELWFEGSVVWKLLKPANILSYFRGII